MGNAPQITSPPSVLFGYWSSASGDMYLICHVTSQDHGIEGSYNFISWRSSLYVPTVPSLMAIDIAIGGK